MQKAKKASPAHSLHKCHTLSFFFSKAPPALWPRLCALRSKYCVSGTFSLSLGRNRKNKIFNFQRIPKTGNPIVFFIVSMFMPVRKKLSLLFVWGNNWCETAPPLPAHCLIDRLVGREPFQITYLCSCLVLALQPAITGHNRTGEERSRLSSANLALALVPMSNHHSSVSSVQPLCSVSSAQCPCNFPVPSSQNCN